MSRARNVSGAAVATVTVTIVLHRPIADNAGRFADAGSTLTIGDAAEEGVIDAERAAALIGSGGAVDPAAIVATEPDAGEGKAGADADGSAG